MGHVSHSMTLFFYFWVQSKPLKIAIPMKKIMMWLLVLPLFAACSNDGPDSADPMQIDLITGLVLYNETGIPIMEFGNPNEKLKQSSPAEDGSIYSPFVAVVYPNPARQIIHLQSKESIAAIWLVKGRKTTSFKNEDFEELVTEHAYPEAELDQISVYHAAISGTAIALNVSAYEKGFYRLFLKTEAGNQYWMNICVDPAFTDFDTFIQEQGDKW